MLDPDKVSSLQDIINYVEGCINDFEGGISEKPDTIKELVDFVLTFSAKAMEEGFKDGLTFTDKNLSEKTINEAFELHKINLMK